MNIDAHLEQLYADGLRNDASAKDRSSMMLNITPSTGAFLDLVVRELKPKAILELGTSNGYSTIWLARAACVLSSHIDTVEISAPKARIAYENLKACNLHDVVTIHNSDCGEFLRKSSSLRYDLVFLDSNRQSYVDWAIDLVRVTRFGLLIVDNATTHPEELLDFRYHMSNVHGMSIVVLPIGNGQMLLQNRE